MKLVPTVRALAAACPPAAAAALAALAAAAACMPNQAGNIGSTKTGDITNPATRGSPVAELRDACGTGLMTLAGEAVVRRKPYLQTVTKSSVTVGWAGRSGTGGICPPTRRWPVPTSTAGSP